MTKLKKILLGVVSTLPFVCITAALTLAMRFRADSFQAKMERGGFGGQPPDWVIETLYAAFGFTVVGLVLFLVLLVFYIYETLSRETLETEMQFFWSLALLVAGFFIYPVHWYLFEWLDELPEAFRSAATSSSSDRAESADNEEACPE